jgi:signal transduction histidine kinase
VFVEESVGLRPVLNPQISSKRQKVNQTVLLIEDNGLGMQNRHLDSIFEKYTRLHADGEGYGIGLYLASKKVSANDGRITVESEPGVGSKFMIYLK